MKTKYYKTMYAYAKDADISHYEHSEPVEDAPYILVEAFQPADDPDFCIREQDTVVRGKATYIRVGWGESEKSYIRTDALYDLCYARYTLSGKYGGYVSDGRVYESKKAAMKKKS